MQGLELLGASLAAQLVKNPPAMQETWFDFWMVKIPQRRARLPIPVFMGFPGDSDSKECMPAMRDLSLTLVWEDPLEGPWEPTPVFLPGKSLWTE